MCAAGQLSCWLGCNEIDDYEYGSCKWRWQLNLVTIIQVLSVNYVHVAFDLDHDQLWARLTNIKPR